MKTGILSFVGGTFKHVAISRNNNTLTYTFDKAMLLYYLFRFAANECPLWENTGITYLDKMVADAEWANHEQQIAPLMELADSPDFETIKKDFATKVKDIVFNWETFENTSINWVLNKLWDWGFNHEHSGWINLFSTAAPNDYTLSGLYNNKNTSICEAVPFYNVDEYVIQPFYEGNRRCKEQIDFIEAGMGCKWEGCEYIAPEQNFRKWREPLTALLCEPFIEFEIHTDDFI